VAALALSVVPVLAFLAALALIDTYKLVRFRRLLQFLGVGCGAALICYLLNTAVCSLTQMPVSVWAQTGGPVLEETVKAIYVWWLIRSQRLGFMVDAAICGFAVGAGFALVENAVYVWETPSLGFLTWLVRGFGTALMHGGATAIFGILARNRTEISRSNRLTLALPGLVAAILIHLFYNQQRFNPTITAEVFLIGIPAVLVLVFRQSEKTLVKWMGSSLDKNLDLLHMIETDTFSQSPAGAYLRSLESTFPPEILGDMLCYLQLSAELSARAKGELLRRELGFPSPLDPEVPRQLKELAFLERTLGRAGKLAVAPLLGSNQFANWQRDQFTV
jgi:RsiW-degrading membrane proteinase PrsW (M82 family)